MGQKGRESEKEQPELRLGVGKGARRCLSGALEITCLRGGGLTQWKE